MLHYFYHQDYPYVEVPSGDKDADQQRETPGGSSIQDYPVPLSLTQIHYRLNPPSAVGQDADFDSALQNDPWRNRRKKDKALTTPPHERQWSGRGMRPHYNLSSQPDAFLQSPNLAIHASVYSIAEKYGIPGLKALALDKFEKEASVHWGTTDFLDAIQEVYTMTVDHDRGMRDAVVKVISSHMELLDRVQVQEVVKNLDLSFDLLMKMRKPTSNPFGGGSGW
jgi:hypothetical protein